jgi:hypothetical protein
MNVMLLIILNNFTFGPSNLSQTEKPMLIRKALKRLPTKKGHPPKQEATAHIVIALLQKTKPFLLQ